MSRVALFDMDHTVLRIDTSSSWMRFLIRRGELSRFYALRALLWGAQYKQAMLDLDTLAERLIADVRGDPESEMIRKTKEWHQRDVAHQVATAARDAILRHREAGDTLVLLTGSNQYAADAVASALSFEHVLSTKLEVKDGRFTGRVAQKCFGVHKVTVAERWAADNDAKLDDAIFYSDSFNDLPMLERVGQPIAVNPDVRLRRHAVRRGWRVELWR